jgi:hypothetical protein
VLRLDAKMDTYIASHEARHVAHETEAQRGFGDLAASPAGRSVAFQLAELTRDVSALTATVAAHESFRQQTVGAMRLLAFVGASALLASIGALVLVGLRIIGVVP